MSLAGTLRRIEKALGSDAEPRRIVVWAGDWLEESWIERHGPVIDFQVRIPHWRDDPMDHLTDVMRRVLRPDDEIVVFEMPINHRDDHNQPWIPPWKRKPYRLIEGGLAYELLIDGVWVRFGGVRQ